MTETNTLMKFQQDTNQLGTLTADLVSSFYPAYSVDSQSVASIPQENSLELLNSFTLM